MPKNWILIAVLVVRLCSFSHLVTSREKRLARALCGTQAPGCSRSVCPLLAAAGGAEGAEGRKPADACWSLEVGKGVGS